MKTHGYKFRLSSSNSGDKKTEYVGTWIGFAGMVLLVGVISVVGSIGEVIQEWLAAVFLSYSVYYASQFLRSMLYVLTLGSIVMSGVLMYTLFTVQCEKDSIMYCETTGTSVWYLFYFASLTLVAGYGVYRSAQSNL